MVNLDNRAGWEPPFECRKAALELATRLEMLGTFPLQVKGLRNCWRPLGGVDAPQWPRPCNRPFCPQCLPYRRRNAFRKWAPKVAAISGPQGEAVAVTLTRPPRSGTLAEEKRAARKTISSLFHRQPWKRPGGFMESVGLLAIIEIGTEGRHDGLVHIHVLVVSAEPGVALAAAQWLLQAWLEVNPDASPLGQDVSLCRGPQDFGAWLNYILKACRLDPSWDDARLEAMALALLDGSQRVTPYGLLHPRQGKVRGTSFSGAGRASKNAKAPRAAAASSPPRSTGRRCRIK